MLARPKRKPNHSMRFALALMAVLFAYSTMSFAQGPSDESESRAAAAQLHYSRQEYEQAVDEWRAARDISRLDPDNHMLMGIALFQLERYQEAIDSFEAAKVLLQTNESVYYTTDEDAYATVDSYIGRALVTAGRYEESLEPLSYTLRVQPHNAEAYYTRAFAYGSLNRLEEALADVEQGLQIWPSNQRFLDLQTALSEALPPQPDASHVRAQAEFVSEMAAQSGARTTESGMVYFVTRQGSGPSPQATDTVRILYRGTDTDGRVFNAFEEGTAGQPLELPYLIPCLQEGIQMMRVGGKRRLVCPANLAYGDHTFGEIEPGSTVIYDIELTGIE